MLRQPRPLVPHTLGQTLPLNLQAGLIGYWKLDESTWSGTPGEVIDSSGHGNHGTAVNGAGPTSSPAKFGRAGAFDRSLSQYVNCGHDSSLYPAAQVTVAAWVYPLIVNRNMQIAGAWTDCYDVYIGQDADNAKIGAALYQSDNFEQVLFPASGADLTANTWHHVAFTADGSNLNLYLNGAVYCSPLSYDGTIRGHNPGHDFLIGGFPSFPTYDLDGYLDDVRVYNRGLSASEIQQLYSFVP